MCIYCLILVFFAYFWNSDGVLHVVISGSGPSSWASVLAGRRGLRSQLAGRSLAHRSPARGSSPIIDFDFGSQEGWSWGGYEGIGRVEVSEVPSDADHKHWKCFSLAGRAVLSDSAGKRKT